MQKMIDKILYLVTYFRNIVGRFDYSICLVSESVTKGFIISDLKFSTTDLT